MKTLAGEAAVAQQRLAQVPDAHQRNAPAAVNAEDRRQAALQLPVFVADAAAAERAEVGEVAPHLRGREPGERSDLPG